MLKSFILKKQTQGFVQFVREQGVVGLAIGFILGTAAKDLVNALVEDIFQPLIGLLFGSTEGLEAAVFVMRGAEVRYGHFLSTMLDFFIIAAVVYFVFKGLKLDKLDLKKE